MNAITPHIPGTKPPAPIPALVNFLSTRLNRMDPTGHYRKGALPKSLTPTEGERRYLESRKAILLSAQQPDPDATRDAIVGILMPYLPTDGDPEMLQALIKTYIMACSEAPGWCMNEAHKAFAKGQTPGIPTWKDKQFRPSPANVLAQALSFTLPFDEELHRINLVLEAEVEEYEPDDAEKQKALAHWATVRSEMLNHMDVTPTTPQSLEEIAADEAEYAKAVADLKAERAKGAITEMFQKHEGNDVPFGGDFTGDDD